MAAYRLGFFKDCEKRPYSCKSIKLSVEELSKNTHAGLDTMGRKNDPQVINKVINQLKQTFKNPNSYKLFNKKVILFKDSILKRMYDMPEIVFHRFQATYDDSLDMDVEKSRIVWCVPYFIVSLENVFFGNIIKSTQRHAKFSNEVIYPIGLTNFLTGQSCIGTLRNKFRRLGNKRLKIYSLDFSKYDTTIPLWVKDVFFSLIMPVLELNKNQKRVYDLLRIYVKYTPFVYNNKVQFKKKGISSGLLVTNLFDTWWNLTLHYFVKILVRFYPEQEEDIYNNERTFDRIKFNTQDVKYDTLISAPDVRVMGDDSIVLCDEYTLYLFQKVCKILGKTVKVKYVCDDPEKDIFFLGRYWDRNNRPFQTEHYMALRITYTKWYDEKNLPFDLKDLHLNRVLSICLPLLGGKEFLDKYLFDYEPYISFRETESGFVYMKDFIEDNFRFLDYDKALDMATY